MKKLATIGALIAALAIPASAAGQRAHLVRARAQALCPQTVVFPPGRDYAICGGRFWIRDANGKIVPVTFWQLQHRNEPPDNRP
jgi:hypothetical protein